MNKSHIFLLSFFLINYITVSVVAVLYINAYIDSAKSNYKLESALEELKKISQFRNAQGKDIDGLYSIDQQYYCVWPNNTTPKETSITEAHELCHHFIENEGLKEHFCN